MSMNFDSEKKLWWRESFNEKNNTWEKKVYKYAEPYLKITENYIDVFKGGNREIEHLKHVKRGSVGRSFSSCGRKRFLLKMDSFRWEAKSFITLTYPLPIFNMSASYQHLKKFVAGLEKWNKKKSIVFWKKEFQGRGVLHYHLITDIVDSYEFNQFIKRLWFSCVPKKYRRADLDFIVCRSEPVRDSSKGKYYISKYVAKNEVPAPDCIKSVGRWWGVFNYENYSKLQVNKIFISKKEALRMIYRIHKDDVNFNDLVKNYFDYCNNFRIKDKKILDILKKCLTKEKLCAYNELQNNLF